MFGWVIDQEVDVIDLAIDFHKLRFEVNADLFENCPKPLDGILVKYLPPVFGHEDQMDVHLENAVSTVSNVA
jgi:hypothetical protein